MANPLHNFDAMPNEADTCRKFGGADQLRNAANQLQSLLYAA
jgi:hypothetical protein